MLVPTNSKPEYEEGVEVVVPADNKLIASVPESVIGFEATAERPLPAVMLVTVPIPPVPP